MPGGTTACASTVRHALLARAEKLEACRRLKDMPLVSLGAGRKPPQSGAPSAPPPA